MLRAPGAISSHVIKRLATDDRTVFLAKLGKIITSNLPLFHHILSKLQPSSRAPARQPVKSSSNFYGPTPIPEPLITARSSSLAISLENALPMRPGPS
jgi:hypothetical protein